MYKHRITLSELRMWTFKIYTCIQFAWENKKSGPPTFSTIHSRLHSTSDQNSTQRLWHIRVLRSVTNSTAMTWSTCRRRSAINECLWKVLRLGGKKISIENNLNNGFRAIITRNVFNYTIITQDLLYVTFHEYVDDTWICGWHVNIWMTRKLQ